MNEFTSRLTGLDHAGAMQQPKQLVRAGLRTPPGFGSSCKAT